MSKIKISPGLQDIIKKYKRKINYQEESTLDKIIEFAYNEGSINGQYELYNNESSKTLTNERN
jgi:hypothetical protein